MRQTLILLFMILLFGCNSNTEDLDSKQLNPTTLSEAYPGTISNVNKVELLDGSTGERKTIEDRKLVQEWLIQIKDVELIPDENQEPRVGYLFGITLYEDSTKKLGFISYSINNVYYQNNEDFVGPIRTFFEKQFGREF